MAAADDAGITEHYALIQESLQELANEGRLREMDLGIATMLIMGVFSGITRWKGEDFTSDEEHLSEETVSYTMAALVKPVR